MTPTRSLSSTLSHFSVSKLDGASPGNSVSQLLPLLNKIKQRKKFYLQSPEMAAPICKNGQVNVETFKHGGKRNIFSKKSTGSCDCLICNEYLAVMKEYNVRRHYETKHQSCTRCAYDNAYDDDRTLVLNEHIKSRT